jgi:hypothetical protein
MVRGFAPPLILAHSIRCTNAEKTDALHLAIIAVVRDSGWMRERVIIGR